jgi:myo-inositol 2-dehydrogenase/D-chiro-inositol 1-dehydrogenase
MLNWEVSLPNSASYFRVIRKMGDWAGGGPSHPPFFGISSERIMSFKIAVIGCGWVSMDCHGPSYARYARTHPGVDLAACCDRDAQKAAAFGERFGCLHAYTQYTEMLQAEKPDAVCLNVPPEAMCSIGCAILEQGYPLLCEKPPGISVAEVDSLLAAARRSGAVHQVAFNRRFMPLVAECKRHIAGQPVQALEIVMARSRRLEADFTTTAVHAVDLARFLLDSDYGDIRFRYTAHEVSGQVVTSYLLDGVSVSGTAVHLGIYPDSGMNVERATVYCADQSFELACSNGLDAPGWLRRYQEDRLAEEISGAQLAGSSESYILNGFYGEDEAFFDAVQAGRQPRDDLASARQSVEIMQALRERRKQYSRV